MMEDSKNGWSTLKKQGIRDDPAKCVLFNTEMTNTGQGG